MLDDFNDNTKTGWTDFTFVPGLGIASEAGGQFRWPAPAAWGGVAGALLLAGGLSTLWVKVPVGPAEPAARG